MAHKQGDHTSVSTQWGVRIAILVLCCVLAVVIWTNPPADKARDLRTPQDEEDEALERARRALAALPNFTDSRGDEFSVYQTLKLTLAARNSQEQTMEFRYAALTVDQVRLPAPVSPVGGLVISAKTSDRSSNRAKGSLFFASIHPQFRELLASRFERLTATNRKTGATINFELRSRSYDQQIQSPSVAYYTFFDDSLEVCGETGGAKQLVFDRSCVSATK